MSMKTEILNIQHDGLSFKVSILISQQKEANWVIGLHGLQSNKEMYQSLYSQSCFDSFSKLAIDFIGFGNSSKPIDFSYDIKDQARIVEKIIEKLNIKSFHLIGHSLGGMVGTLLLKTLQEKVLSFINLEGNLKLEDCGTSIKIASKSFEYFKQKGFSSIKASLRNMDTPNASLRYKWVQMIPDYSFYKTSKSIVEWSKSNKLFEIFTKSKNKKIFIFGDKNYQKTNNIKNDVKCIGIKNAGHFMYLDNPEKLTQEILYFFTSQN